MSFMQISSNNGKGQEPQHDYSDVIAKLAYIGKNQLKFVRNFLGVFSIVVIVFHKQAVPALITLLNKAEESSSTEQDSSKTKISTPNKLNHSCDSCSNLKHTKKRVFRTVLPKKHSDKSNTIHSYKVIGSTLLLTEENQALAGFPVSNKDCNNLEEQESLQWARLINSNALHYHDRPFIKDIIKGVIISSASVVTYKDIRVHITFLSSTGQPLNDGEDIIIRELLLPGGSVHIHRKLRVPAKTTDVCFAIVGATPVIKS